MPKISGFHQLGEIFNNNQENRVNCKGEGTGILSVYTRRSYLMADQAVYDYLAGHEVLIYDNSCVFNGNNTSVLDARLLTTHGYDRIALHYNQGSAPVMVELR